MAKVYLGLGSNLDDRRNYIELALKALKEEELIDVLRISSIIETEAEGNPHQPQFLNTVCETETNLSPIDLLGKLKKIERKLGRPKEHEKSSPRTIDIDILTFDDLLLKGKTLIIPHPKLHKRYFVLYGLNELAPQLFIPKHEKTVSQLLSELKNSHADNQER
ncbi:2-amino-4-hydroxy-6-hydroxymethyldihydropteridine diphosphokinase [bacterium]|nr:2-amino-4-hydroxy-6-hydroxymethyldihydropteridine diphosphokinase [bacterium]